MLHFRVDDLEEAVRMVEAAGGQVVARNVDILLQLMYVNKPRQDILSTSAELTDALPPWKVLIPFRAETGIAL